MADLNESSCLLESGSKLQNQFLHFRKATAYLPHLISLELLLCVFDGKFYADSSVFSS